MIIETKAVSQGAERRRSTVEAALIETPQGEGIFEGYAALFGVADLGRDILMPGAFAASLSRRGAGAVKLLYQHDPARPIGTWLEIAEDPRGLKVRGQLLPELEQAREVLSLMRAGIIDGLSIGFRTIRGKRDAATGVRRLHEVDLWEISVVTFPMQEGARITQQVSAKAAIPRRATQPDKRLLDAGRRLVQGLRA
ncbi:HK97 family phage prohead protease [Breoghania sp.]|uniref:HK97 family phage prohead protease n=1 Tax=Breoghania sp. TaxID=2065378 RepID=UPI0029CA0733|nr:HK97 family phage prohead protease [Breoghania sp.]